MVVSLDLEKTEDLMIVVVFDVWKPFFSSNEEFMNRSSQLASF